MAYAEAMIKVHPRRPVQDLELIVAALESVSSCAATCRTCADACLAEDMVGDLIHCIRVTQDCADVCQATSSLLARLTEPDGALLGGQLAACITACGICAEECERHASMHEHCRICADSCRRCESACGDLLASFKSLA